MSSDNRSSCHSRKLLGERPTGWASLTLAAARHDIDVAHEHGIIDAINPRGRSTQWPTPPNMAAVQVSGFRDSADLRQPRLCGRRSATPSPSTNPAGQHRTRTESLDRVCSDSGAHAGRA